MSLRRKLGIGIAAVLVAGLAYGVFGWYPRTRNAVAIGAAMLAKQMCSCVFVAHRGVEDCRADQFASMDAIRLEVVAVQAEPPSGAPGTVAQLELVHSAMILPSESPDAEDRIDPSQVRVAWLGGCHNPPSGQYYGCLPMLRVVAEQLPSPLPDAIPEGAVPEGILGVGESFAVPIPDDILVETKPSRDGVRHSLVWNHQCLLSRREISVTPSRLRGILPSPSKLLSGGGVQGPIGFW